MADTIAALCRTDHPRLVPEMPVRAAVSALVAARVSVAPVLDAGGALAGILSQKDCFRPALQAAYYQQWSGTVADHMTAKVATLDAAMDMVAAAEAFLAAPYRAYPVLAEGRLAGMLHRSDLLAAFLRAG